MKSEEIKAQIKDLSNKCFMLNMNDHWSKDDFDTYNKWMDEIKELEEQLKEE